MLIVKLDVVVPPFYLVVQNRRERWCRSSSTLFVEVSGGILPCSKAAFRSRDSNRLPGTIGLGLWRK